MTLTSAYMTFIFMGHDPASNQIGPILQLSATWLTLVP